MSLRSFAVLICILVLPAGAEAQILHAYSSPLDVPTNPRSVAMGESNAALPGNPAALMSNPAGLAGLRGIGISYAQRSMNWISYLEEYKFIGVNSTYAAPFGVFGIQYNRYNMGEFVVSTPESPNGVGVVKSYAHSIVIGFGMNLAENLSVGAAAKYLDYVYIPTGGSSASTFGIAAAPAYLFDVGGQYSMPFSPADSSIGHVVTLGASLQNFGTYLKWSSSTGPGSSYEAPRYLRLGLSYQLNVPQQGPEYLRPVALAMTAEYRRVINGSTDQISGREYWGCGAEGTLFEVASVRLGGVIMPSTSIYGEEGQFILRWGFGMHVPLARLGVPVPLIVSGNYARIPINKNPNPVMSGDTDNLSVFSIELEYGTP